MKNCLKVNASWDTAMTSSGSEKKAFMPGRLGRLPTSMISSTSLKKLLWNDIRGRTQVCMLLSKKGDGDTPKEILEGKDTCLPEKTQGQQRGILPQIDGDSILLVGKRKERAQEPPSDSTELSFALNATAREDRLERSRSVAYARSSMDYQFDANFSLRRRRKHVRKKSSSAPCLLSSDLFQVHDTNSNRTGAFGQVWKSERFEYCALDVTHEYSTITPK